MNKLVLFLNEVKAEIRKITWPKKDELVGSTLIVSILILFFATVLGAMDFAFASLIKQLFGYK